jgi:hypothetical protein
MSQARSRRAGVAATLAGVGLLVAALVAGPASASRPATTPQAEFIIQGVETSPLTKRIPKSDYEVRRMRVSTVNPRYASAYLQATPGARNKVQSVALLLKQQSSGAWKLLDLDAISCNLAPRKVLNDLFGGCIPR